MWLEEDFNEIKSEVYFKITNYKRIKLILDLQQWQGETKAETQVTTQNVCKLNNDYCGTIQFYGTYIF